ncbi:MAG: DUF2029 domain-containing protein [Anaerolineae bacterium]|nr:DUF2029 domain-containing protein [Anaerolineae bacterium]
MEICTLWADSKWYRCGVIAAALYATLRLLIHFVSLEWAVSLSDLAIYLLAAERAVAHQPLYLVSELATASSFQYAPVIAALFVPLLSLPEITVSILFSLFHVLIYILLIWRWDVILHRCGFAAERRTLWALLPLTLVYEVFWSDIGYLNVYILMPLLATLLLEAILEQKWMRATVWLSIILPIKPFWAFPILLPALFRRWKFLAAMVAAALAVYLATILLTCSLFSVDYGLQEYVAYFQFINQMSSAFAWRTLNAGLLLGYNHSLKQTFVYFLGASPFTLGLVTALKTLLLLPLAWTLFKLWRRPPGSVLPRVLDLFFALYLGIFIWLDVVWEVALALVLLAWLWPRLKRVEKWVAGLAVIPLSLMDIWRLLSYLAFGDSIMTERGDILIDPSAYAPLILLELAALYGLTLLALWREEKETHVEGQA